MLICFGVGDPFIGIYNFGNQGMSDYVFLIQENKINAFNIFQDVGGGDQPGNLVPGKVYLRDIAGDQEFGGLTHSRKKHL